MIHCLHKGPSDESQHSAVSSVQYEIPKELKRKYQGCRARRKQRLRERRYRAYLPSVILGNVRSLLSKDGVLNVLHGGVGVNTLGAKLVISILMVIKGNQRSPELSKRWTKDAGLIAC